MLCYNNINILYYDRINVSEGIDINKTNESKECDVCHNWYFLDLLMISINLTGIKHKR